ncbi:hypothetical protein PR048_013089 [Dryococelus australis]|uniref:HAT C-terminal dimerisation domain-containing protein n=1 Tax=Dryococelus australis TaxID=614101 RepID=A0ABQ9HR52_9NEOP|nr:hypothetical protein PR048_013089 [Dryococelus australis]
MYEGPPIWYTSVGTCTLLLLHFLLPLRTPNAEKPSQQIRVDKEAERRELLSEWKVVFDLVFIQTGQWFPECEHAPASMSSVQKGAAKYCDVEQMRCVLGEQMISLYSTAARGSEVVCKRDQKTKEIPEIVLEVFDDCGADTFPTIRVLLQLWCTIPVSIATAERSFPTLQRVKSSHHQLVFSSYTAGGEGASYQTTSVTLCALPLAADWFGRRAELEISAMGSTRHWKWLGAILIHCPHVSLKTASHMCSMRLRLVCGVFIQPLGTQFGSGGAVHCFAVGTGFLQSAVKAKIGAHDLPAIPFTIHQ